MTIPAGQTSTEAKCWCCGDPIVPRDQDPWEGRMDGYCEPCAQARCDTTNADCPRKFGTSVATKNERTKVRDGGQTSTEARERADTLAEALAWLRRLADSEAVAYVPSREDRARFAAALVAAVAELTAERDALIGLIERWRKAYERIVPHHDLRDLQTLCDGLYAASTDVLAGGDTAGAKP